MFVRIRSFSCAFSVVIAVAAATGCATDTSSKQRLPTCSFSDIAPDRSGFHEINVLKVHAGTIQINLDNYERNVAKGLGDDLQVSEDSNNRARAQLRRFSRQLAVHEERLDQLRKGECVSQISAKDAEQFINSHKEIIQFAEATFRRLEETREIRESRSARRSEFYGSIKPLTFPESNLELQLMDFNGKRLKLQATNTHSSRITEINLQGHVSYENQLGGVEHSSVCKVNAKDQFGNTYRISKCYGSGKLYPGDRNTITIEVPRTVQNAVLTIEIPLSNETAHIEIPIWEDRSSYESSR